MEILLIFIVGLAMGSFLSATAWRLHQLEGAKSKKAKEKYSISKGRSMCEHCGHQLSGNDLVPVLSWVLLGGKCRYCQHRLSWEYPLAELATALLYVLSYLAWDVSDNFGWLSLGVWLAMLSILIVLAIYDLKWLLLPNKLVYPLIMIAGLMVFVEAVFFGGGPELVRDSVYGLLAIGGVFYLLFMVSGGRWIGGGDVKLGIYAGIYLGLSRSILTFVLAFNVAALVIIPLLLMKIVKPKSKIPFGPFIILAIIISTLYGYSIIDWYGDTFLYGLL